MPKSTAITIIVVVLLLITGGLALWYYSLSKGDLAKSTSENGGGLNNLFPFGNSGGQNNNGDQKGGLGGQGGKTENAPQVRQISELPVSGFIPLLDNLSFPFVRYVEQETGHVYSAPLQIVSKKRISNTTIPKSREAIFIPGGESFIIRYLDDKEKIQSFYATLKKSSTSTTSVDEKSEEMALSGKFLIENISALDLIPASSAKTLPKTLYITTDSSGASFFVSEIDGSKSAKIYSNPLKDWLVFGVNDSLAYILSKSSGKAPSYAFSLNLKTGLFLPILSNIYGLSILPNKKGDLILYSDTSSGYPGLSIYNTSKASATPIALKTFADKCVWGTENLNVIICAVPSTVPSGIYPDNWYQGKISFSDDIWEINATTGETKELVNLYDNSFFLDASSVALSDKDQYLLIVDKPTYTLWSVRLKE